MCFKIFASEQIERKGKTPIEEILKNIKDEVIGIYEIYPKNKNMIKPIRVFK